MNMDLKKTARFIIPIIVALVSIFVVAKYAGSPETHLNTIQALDEKKTTVMELTAASTASSVAITAMPGDVGTPIAEKIVDLSSCFLIVLCALYLEKYLVTITGFVAFGILIPLACGLWAANVFMEREAFTRLAKKLAIFGVAIVLVIPASVKMSNLIETTYSASMQATLDAAKEEVEVVEVEEEKSFWESLVDDIKETVVTTKEGAEQKLNQFIEAIAIMLVTTCAIPILVLFFFIWLVKVILGVDVELPKSRKKIHF